MRWQEPVYLAVGSAAIVWERAGSLVTRTATTATSRGRSVVAGLSAHGERLTHRSRRKVGEQLGELRDRVAASPQLTRMIEIQVDRLLEPLVERALPVVFDRLDQHRDQLRTIVFDYGEDMTGEIVGGIRKRAAAADGLAEDAARRLVGRRRDRPASAAGTGETTDQGAVGTPAPLPVRR